MLRLQLSYKDAFFSCNIVAHVVWIFLSHSLHSDGEELSTADNFNDIYYSLKYEADLLFTRFVSFSVSYETVQIAEARTYLSKLWTWNYK